MEFFDEVEMVDVFSNGMQIGGSMMFNVSLSWFYTKLSTKIINIELNVYKW